ncbi:MAG: hypothetical protein JSS35_18220 [Proteobacteria bacterium]|nr:hypothetical protein [Pseudomonadota bacterium]
MKTGVMALTALLATGAVGASDASGAGKAPAPAITLSIRPGPADEAANTGEAEVEISVPNVHAAAGEPLFTAPLGVTPTLADDAGPAPIKAGAAGDEPPNRTYSSGRAVNGGLKIRYRMDIRNTADNGGTTPIFPRLDGHAFSAIGMTFFAVPQVKAPYRLRIHWDLSRMGPGAAGVSSLGDGDAEGPPGPVASRLENMVVMAGDLHRARLAGDNRFEAVWSGDPGFDPRPAMDWTAKLHAWMVDFFQTPDDPAYRVFLRNNAARNPGGGVAFPNSFFATWGQGVDGESLKQILGHEMTHTFTANDLGRWYVEGDAVYYQVQLPWRAHMVSTEQYLRDINLTAARYYTNLKIHGREEEIGPNFFKDRWLNTLAYDRGALYFAQLNGMLRRKTHGARSIDDLVRVMVRKGRNGEEITDETWYALIRKEIGEEAVTLTKSMLEGGVVTPASDDYGPCFRRLSTRIRRYELGFDPPKALPGRPVTVAGLQPDSEAAKAGLKEGDLVILPPLTSEGPRRDPQATVTAKVTRGGKTFQITWLPRGEAVDGYQWERVPGVPDEACRPPWKAPQ